MNAPQDALLGGEGLIILHKIVMQSHLLKVAGAPGFHKIAALIAEHLGLNDQYAGQARFDFFHQYLTLPSATARRCMP